MSSKAMFRLPIYGRWLSKNTAFGPCSAHMPVGTPGMEMGDRKDDFQGDWLRQGWRYQNSKEYRDYQRASGWRSS